ncbi:bifunctional UDP-sugar hydrolase/5'-nucleotidase UshA [Paludibacterium sp. B53371]|uniref:bifunctional UDP-sugar hydrolase/5'-nucleotidase UshA n=1 Tax=Paludibacterium sp. B53371 TaxID=2806263 RepID=UPI001C04C995|nr:bifunctional UDP-sugar hydrolase/5'-nucleotidase UshA [Paludibacterium sp. B53371]
MQCRLSSLLVLGLLAGSWAQAAQPGKTYDFTIVHTNDLHGRFWPDADGEYGLAAQKALIDQIRAEVRQAGGRTLVLNAGDVNTGVPESDMQDAEPMFRGMNAIAYDAMALGNHEFDKPRSVLLRQKGWAAFPLLSANLYQGKTRPFAATAQFDLGGLKVAVLGLTTPDTPKLVNPQNLSGAHFVAPEREAAKLVPALRRKADVVIALTHLGYYPDGQHGVNAPGDVELARTVPGIDVIVGGHSHTAVCMSGPNQLETTHQPGAPCRPDQQNGTWIMQTGEWGKSVGCADFRYQQGKLTLVRYTLIPVNLKHAVTSPDGKTSKVTWGAPITPDPVMVSLLTPYQQKGQQVLSQPVGQLDSPLDGAREHVRSQPTSMGRFAGEAFMAQTGADLALMNGGGVRDSLPAGAVSYRDVLKVFPFGSTVVTVELRGDALLDLLTKAALMTPGSGGYPQMAGVRLIRQEGKLTGVEVGGKPLDPQRQYKLVTNSFLAAGGDGYPRLNRLPGYVDTGFVDADVLKNYLAARSPIKAADYAP